VGTGHHQCTGGLMVRQGFRSLLIRIAIILLVAGLVIGITWSATPRYDPVQAAVAEAKAELAKAAKARAPNPGVEEALRLIIPELQRGTPDYSRMTTSLANIVRRQISQNRFKQTELGPLRS